MGVLLEYIKKKSVKKRKENVIIHPNKEGQDFGSKSPSYVCNALGSLASCSLPGEKAVANAENRSSGSMMFSKYLSSFISFGAMLLRLFFVALYRRYIMSLTCTHKSKEKGSENGQI